MAERREKGTGSIFQTKDAKWRGTFEITARDQLGHKKTKNFTGKTEAEVIKKMKVWKLDQEKFATKSIQKMLFSTYIKHWLEVTKAPTLRPASYKRLKCTIDYHIIPNIGQIPVGKLMPKHIQRLIDMLSECENPQHSFSSIKKVRDAINSCLQDGVDKGLLVNNPCVSVKLPSFDNQKPRKSIQVFSEAETRVIIEECLRKYKNGKPIYYYGAMYLLILNTGLRLGEALALSWENVDLENRVIHIDSTLCSLSDEKGKAYLAAQKITETSSFVRDIPLNDNAIIAIDTLKLNGSTKYVLESRIGDCFSPENLQNGFYHILEICSLPKLGIHALRHTFACDQYAISEDQKRISELLGNASISVTENIYTKALRDARQATVDLLNKPKPEDVS